MTVTAAGYELLETVAESESRLLLRAVDPTGARVVVKLPRKEHPGQEEVARLRHELEIAAALPESCAVRPVRVEQFGNRIGLVLPDVGGVALSALIPRQGFDPTTFLDLACALTTAVSAIHEAGLIHRDLKPDNVLTDPQLSWVRVTDFGLATRLARLEVSEAIDRPVGTLAYLAPEQTGRMNRSVDQRSDLYSLGVTLYQMATGRPPFLAAGALELIHAHLAALPTDPRELNPTVPDGVAKILLRLLAKQPEDRYQTAPGLAADLSRAHQQWSTDGQVPSFELATADRTLRARIPERLFGRDQELAQLAAAVQDAAEGRGKLALLSGVAGVGKSALVAELGPVLAAAGARFVARKFDQYAQGFSPPTALIIQFTRQVLREPPERVDAVRRELEARVGPNLGVLIELAPDLKLVVGEYPPPVRLGPVETQQRFITAFTEFFAVFAKPRAPAVFLLDDLQWAKQSNITLLGTTLTHELSRHTLVIAAYRPAEVHSDHPLIRMVEGLDPAHVVRIDLQPLTPGATQDLVSATLGRAERQLSAWLHELTDGNPFYLRQVLEALAEDELLQAGANAPPVDLATVRAHNLTGDIVEFLLNRFEELPETTQRLLRVAALIGNRFSLDLLATAAGVGPVEVAGALTPALRAGLLLTPGDEHELVGHAGAQMVEYRFRHDRVQQAVHRSIPVEDLPQLHLAIGRLLRRQVDVGHAELFAVVSHLGAAAALLDAAERIDLMRLNLAAARRAKNSGSHDAIAAFLTAASRLLPPDAWQQHYADTFAIHADLGETLAVLGRIDESEPLFAELLEHAQSDTDIALAHAIRSESLFAAGRIADAVEPALAGLSILGTPLSTSREDASAAMAALLSLDAVPRLADAGPGPDEAALLGRLWSDAVFASYMCGSPDFVPILVQAVTHLSEVGVTPGSTLPVAYLAMEAARAGHLAVGVAYAEAAVALARAWDPVLRGTITTLAWTYCLNWNHHIDDQIAAQREAFWECQGSGATIPANYALVSEAYAHAAAGRRQVETLDIWTRAQEHGSRYAPQMGPALDVYVDATRELSGLPQGPFDREAAIAAYEIQSPPLAALAMVEPIRIAAMLGQYDQAYRYATRARAIFETIGGVPTGLWVLPYYVGFAVSAARLAADATDPESRNRALADAAFAVEQFRPFAEFPPQPWLAYLHLLEAELASAQGQADRATRHHVAAIDEAARRDYPQLQGWANELLGRLHLQQGRRLGRAHLVEARRLYEQSAAAAKVTQLDAEFPYLASSTTPTDGTPDLATVLSASQAIAAEVSPDRVIDALLAAARAATGADTAAFVSPGGPVPAGDGTPLLAFPLRHKGNLLGTLVLERPAAFGAEARAALELLAPQAGISLENAALYADLETKVAQRSGELSATAAQLHAMQDQIVQTETLAALGGLVAGVAHEINNPIGIAVSAASHLVTRSAEFAAGYAGGQLRRSELEEFLTSAADAAELILANADRAAAMVAGFKQIAVDQAGEARRHFTLAAYLSDVVASLAPKLRGTAHRIEIDIDPDLTLTSYPGALAQVATNLVLNSLLHAYPDTDRPGLLRFTATATDTDTNRIRLTYTDDGTGIPPEHLPRIFEAFFTTRSGQGGSGLGLHIVHNLITQRLAGTITVTSTPGHGTQFDIELPVDSP